MALSNSGRFDDTLDAGYVSLAVSVTTSAIEAKVGGSRLAGRQELLLYNDSTTTAYFGPSTVTASGANKGIILEQGDFIQVPAGEDIAIFLITASGTATVIVQELG